MLYLPPGTVASGTGLSYSSTTGIGTFTGTSLNATSKNATDTYTVTITAPTTGDFSAVSAISGPYVETNRNNNVAIVTVPVTQPAAPTAYDEVTAVSGPASALPGATVTYTVQTINNGPALTPSATQTVTLPVGVTATNISGNGIQSGQTITFPAVTNQAAGSGGIVTNTFTVTVPATAYTITANVTAAGESNTTNNSSVTSTSVANQAPIANNVVNALQQPEGNTAGQLAISPLAATDIDGTIAAFQLTSIPNATTQGTLYYNNAGTYTAITSATQPLTPAQAQTLRFDPVAGYIGNVFFSYTATDNTGAVSLPALFTIQVGQDNASLYSTTPTKSGTSPTFSKYANGDVLAYVVDVNGAQYNGAGLLYDPTTGALAAGAANGLPTSGTNVTSTTTPAQFAALGFALNPATGIISVLDRTKLVAGSYPFTLTTTDLFGGVTQQVVTIVIGARPLPVELKDFTATAVKNVDAQLAWTTASEKNNDHFDVERSLNGTDFVKIGQVKGQGNSAAPTEYILTDSGIGSKVSAAVYYRLKQVDTDGTATFSPVRTLTFAKSAVAPAISLAPNPATDATQLDLTQLPMGAYQVSVLDATGRVVLSATYDTTVAHTLQLNTIASGTYVVLVRGQNGGQVINLTKRLIKE